MSKNQPGGVTFVHAQLTGFTLPVQAKLLETKCLLLGYEFLHTPVNQLGNPNLIFGRTGDAVDPAELTQVAP